MGYKKGFKGRIADTPPKLDLNSADRDRNDKKKAENLAIKEAIKNSVNLTEAYKGSSSYVKLHKNIDFDKVVARNKWPGSKIPDHMQYLGASGPFCNQLTDKALIMN